MNIIDEAYKTVEKQQKLTPCKYCGKQINRGLVMHEKFCQIKQSKNQDSLIAEYSSTKEPVSVNTLGHNNGSDVGEKLSLPEIVSESEQMQRQKFELEKLKLELELEKQKIYNQQLQLNQNQLSNKPEELATAGHNGAVLYTSNTTTSNAVAVPKKSFFKIDAEKVGKLLLILGAFSFIIAILGLLL